MNTLDYFPRKEKPFWKSTLSYALSVSLFLISLSLASQDLAKRLPTKFAFPSRHPKQDLKLGKTAPRIWADVERVQFPEPNQFRLTFPSNKSGSYKAPDSGEVYLWSKGLYRWTRKDNSIYTEWDSGNWTLITADGTTLKYTPKKDTPGNFSIVYSDKIYRKISRTLVSRSYPRISKTICFYRT